MPFIRPLALCAIVLAAAMAQAQMPSMGAQRNPTFKPGGPDELWDVTMKMEIAGMPMQMPEQTTQVCTRKGHKESDLVPANDQCTVSDVKTSGNRTTFAMACKGDPPMSGNGEITSTGNSYSGRMTVRSTRRGEDMTMTQTFTGRRAGNCTDTSQQYVAKLEADGKAQVAKACSDQMDALAHPMFESGAICAGQRRQFCDRATGVANEMREPAGHAAARRKYGQSLQGAFTLCGQDYAAVSKAACGSAVGGRNWSFVGSGPCDADVRAHAPKYCVTGANRSPDPQFSGLCARYATLTRGTGMADSGSGTTAAAPKPAPQDPVTQGVDAVKRMFKF